MQDVGCISRSKSVWIRRVQHGCCKRSRREGANAFICSPKVALLGHVQAHVQRNAQGRGLHTLVPVPLQHYVVPGEVVTTSD